MADYWAKVYIEILEDPKMAILPDRLWRRFIELILVAKKLGTPHLPETNQIAWLLRMHTDELETDLMQLSQTTMVIQEDNGWFLPNFEKRQSAATSTERVQQYRKRQQQQQYYGDVTQLERKVTQNTETETESETEGDNGIFSAYEANIGVITPMIADEIKETEREYSQDMILDAIGVAVQANVRKWSYVKGILRRWKTNGKDGGKMEEYERPASEVY